MALVECRECGGVVSDAASTCPHCGYPNPSQGTRPEVSEAHRKSKETPVVSEPEARRFWPVVLWGIGFFVLGVAVNAGIEAGGIALSGDFSRWSDTYRSSWFWRLLPYGIGTVGVLIGLARRRAGNTGRYRWLSVGLAGALAIGIAAALLSASAQGSEDSALVLAPTTSTTTTPASTTTTLFIEIGPSEHLSLPSYNRVVTFWNYEWTDTAQFVVESVNSGNEAEARVECELFKGRPKETLDAVADMELLTGFSGSEELRIVEAMFREMETLLVECSAGSWEAVKQSSEVITSYMDRFSTCWNVASGRDSTDEFDCQGFMQSP